MMRAVRTIIHVSGAGRSLASIARQITRAPTTWFTAGALLLWSLTATALGQNGASVTLEWDASPDLDISGYLVYYGPASGEYTELFRAGAATECTVTGLEAETTYFFVVTALNNAGWESEPSNEISHTPPVEANAPPTLHQPPNVLLQEDAGHRWVTLSGVSDGDPSQTQPLTVTALSSNPALVPNPAVLFNETNGMAALSLTPKSNAFGSTTITIQVNDGQIESNVVVRRFQILVAAVNDPPTLDPIPPLTLLPGTSPRVIPLSGISSGAGNEAQTLTITAESSHPALIPAPMVLYTNPNRTGGLLLFPPAHALGSAVITVTVSDGQGTSGRLSRSFPVAVRPMSLPVLQMLPGGGLRFTWDSLPQAVYRVVSKLHLAEPEWTELSPEITAQGTTTSWTDLTAPAHPYRYYQLQCVQ